MNRRRVVGCKLETFDKEDTAFFMVFVEQILNQERKTSKLYLQVCAVVFSNYSLFLLWLGIRWGLNLANVYVFEIEGVAVVLQFDRAST